MLLSLWCKRPVSGAPTIEIASEVHGLRARTPKGYRQAKCLTYDYRHAEFLTYDYRQAKCLTYCYDCGRQAECLTYH